MARKCLGARLSHLLTSSASGTTFPLIRLGHSRLSVLANANDCASTMALIDSKLALSFVNRNVNGSPNNW